MSARAAGNPPAATPLADVEPAQPGWLRRVYKAHDKFFLGTAAVVVFLLMWQWAGTSGAVNPLFSSSPQQVLLTFRDMAEGDLAKHIAVSGKEFLYGFLLGVAMGVPLGILVGWYRPIDGLLDPFVSFFYATPRVALVPLLIIWLGIGFGSKVAVVFLGAIFAVLINTAAGVKNLDASLVRAARSFGATNVQIFRTIALPGSVPYIVSGMRLGLGHALIGIVVGELYGANAGVGYLMAAAVNTYQTDKVFVGVLIIAGTGILFTAIFQRIEQHFQAWKAVR